MWDGEGKVGDGEGKWQLLGRGGGSWGGEVGAGEGRWELGRGSGSWGGKIGR